MQRVSPETQNVLRAAAVIGRHFEPDLLEEVADIDGDALIAALDEAEQRPHPDAAPRDVATSRGALRIN